MDEPISISHEWTISGLSSVCDRITAHPAIKSSIDGKLEFYFYPNGFDEHCREYVSFWVYSSIYRKYSFIELKISIRNTKKENLFVKEWTMMKWNDYNIIKEYIKRDYLLDPANGLTNNDEFTLCFEGWLHNSVVNNLSNLENKTEWTRDYFNFSPLLSTKSLTLKLTIENVTNLFEKSNKSSVELPEIKDSTETDEAIFRSRIELIKNLNNKKMLLFELKSDDKRLIVIEMSAIDINQQKYHRSKKGIEGSISNEFTKYFNIDETNSRESIFADNKLTLLCEITMITEPIKEENKINYLRTLECFKVGSAFQITECTIKGETGEILQNKVVPLISNIENKETEIEKLEELSTSITETISTIDNTIINVNNIFHEHYFENCNIKDSVVNTKSKSRFGDISLKSDKTDSTELIEKLEDILREIKPVLDKNEQMHAQILFTQYLFIEILTNQEETKKELNALQRKLSQMKQTKKVKKSKMKKIVDRIIALLNRIKYELKKVYTNVRIKVTQVRQSKPSAPKSPEPTLVKSNSITENIKPQISSLIEYVQSVTISQSNSTKTKQSNIHKLETVEANLIAHLSTENCFTINPNAHLEIDSITLENAEHKLADIHNNVLSTLSSIEDKEIYIEKLEELSNEITEQTSTIDQTITNVFIVVYNGPNFKNANLNGVLQNTNSNSTMGNVNIKTDSIDHVPVIEKLENIVSSEIKPFLDQMLIEMKTLKSYNAALVEVIFENQQELCALQKELHKMKHSKKVKKAEMKQIVDRIIALLNRIKYELNKVMTNIRTIIAQVRQSMSTQSIQSEPTLEKSSSVAEYIESHTSSLIKYVQSVPTSISIRNKTKESYIYKLEAVKSFLIAHLPVESCSVGNHITTNLQNDDFEIDSMTIENDEKKLTDIIDNRSDGEKKLLTQFIVESKSESGNKEETERNNPYKLEAVKSFLIAHLSTENCSTINPNAHFEIDSITLENAEHKLADIIDNHSDGEKKLLTKLRDVIVESKSESGNKEETERNNPYELEADKSFLIAHLPVESCSVGNNITTNLQNEDFEIDSMTIENDEKKLTDIIDNRSDGEKMLLTKLREMIVE